MIYKFLKFFKILWNEWNYKKGSWNRSKHNDNHSIVGGTTYKRECKSHIDQKWESRTLYKNEDPVESGVNILCGWTQVSLVFVLPNDTIFIRMWRGSFR